MVPCAFSAFRVLKQPVRLQDGSWHAFVAAYEGGLGNWDPNSHIVHAIAGKGVGPEGPYELAGESADTSTVVGKYHASPGILKVGGLYYLFVRLQRLVSLPYARTTVRLNQPRYM